MTPIKHTQTSTTTTGAISTVRLQDVLRLIWNGKWYLTGSVLISLALGAAYLSETEPIYKVGARLLVQQEGSPLERDERNHVDKNFLATQGEIIRSPAVVELAASSLGGMPNDVAATSRVLSILDTLRVSPLTGTNVLSISFHSRDANRAVRTVNAVIDSYKKFLHEMDHDSNFEALNLLTENEKILRNDLESLETQYRNLRKGSPLMGQGPQAASVQRTLLENLGMSLSETRTRRIELENQIEIMKLSSENGAELLTMVSAPAQTRSGTAPADNAVEELTAWQGSVVPNTQNESHENLNSYHEQLALAEVRQQALERRFGEKHPQMKVVREEIRSWKRILQDSIQNAPKVLERDLATIQLQEQRLTGLYQEEFEKAKFVDGHLLEEQQALAGIERVQLIHDSTLTQLRELQLTDQALINGRSRVRVGVLEGPSLANSKIWPQKSLVLGASLATGLLIGMGLSVSFARDPTSRAQSSEEWQESTDSAVG